LFLQSQDFRFLVVELGLKLCLLGQDLRQLPVLGYSSSFALLQLGSLALERRFTRYKFFLSLSQTALG